MHPNPETARRTLDCKIKRVNPAVRSVSTPRGTKDLPVVGRVNRVSARGNLPEPAFASEWSAEGLSERLRIELPPGAWKRLVHAAERRGASVEQLLRLGLSEVA
jgi:hypothetical protein